MSPSPIGRPERLRPSVSAVLAIGGNLGEREATLKAAIADLNLVDGIRVEVASRLFETPAIRTDGVDLDAPAYLNGVVIVSTTLDAHALLDAVNAIEAAHGRVRVERWGDRTLDIDIVDFGGRESSDERLTLPHPHAAERAFVLAPWHDVQPDAVLVGHGPVATLLAAATDAVAPYESPEVDES